MKSHSETVSVVMPVFNAERYVAQAIESIRAQTFRDFRFIIVDDGSTDGALGILNKYAALDSRICVLSRPNTGIVGALNDGLARAEGKYIARMDADDQCEPNRFELQVRRMESEPDLVALGSCAVAIDPSGNPIGDAPVPLTHEEIEERHLKGQPCIFHPAAMLRASAVRAVGGYREGMCPCEDLDLWLRLGEVGRLANLPERLFIWRRNTDGVVASKGQLMRSTIERIVSEAWARRRIQDGRVDPEVECSSPLELYRQWGWSALKHGHRATARRYARKALYRQPWSSASWRLALCAARGY